MLRKILFKTKYFLIVVLVGVLVLTLFPTILDGGSAEQVQSFVTRFYVQCLGRQPDSEGLNEWIGRLLNGTKTGADVAEGFVFSEEFTGKNHSNETFVTILYRAFFEREPDASGYKAWLERLAGGMSRKSVLDGFLKSQEFAGLCSNYGIVPYAGAPTYTASTASTYSGYSSSGAAGFQEGRKVNFIIWGDDSASDRPGGRVSGRTDINIFVHMNLDTRKMYLVTIPRDTWFGGRKINGYHTSGGNAGAVSAFERFTGAKIDFYAVTDFDGFAPLIDYFGGVDTTVEENIADSFSGCYLAPGMHNINGTEALALSRARHGRSSYGGGAYARERQSAMLLADLLLQKRSMVSSGNLSNFLNTMGQYVWTNISLSQAAQILPAVLSMKREDITITTFNSWPQWFGKSSAVGYNEAEKNQFFRNILNQ
ncbi:Polyisoprenyl-teichoic acid--peptidoglycan teichoic acid transferase TagU [subsurface metagenome]